MKTFQSKIKKVFYKNGKLKEYNISLGVKSEIEDDKFYENENGKLICDVIVCYEDDFDNLLQENTNLQNKVKDLEGKLNKKTQTNKDSTSSLYEKIDELTLENKKLKETHSNELIDITAKHQEDLKSKDDEYSQKIDVLNKDLLSQSEANKKEVLELKDEYIQSNKDLQKEIDSLKQEISDIKDKHHQEINNLTIYDEEYHMKLSDHEKKINEMRSNCLRLRTIDSNNNLRQIDNLEKLGRLDKFRNRDKEILREMRQFNQKIVDEDAIDVEFNLIDEANANNNKR